MITFQGYCCSKADSGRSGSFHAWNYHCVEFPRIKWHLILPFNNIQISDVEEIREFPERLNALWGDLIKSKQSITFPVKMSAIVWKQWLARKTLKCQQILHRLRSIYPDVINHFASQSHTCQLLKIISFKYWKEIVESGAILGLTDKDQLQIWNSHSLIFSSSTK